MVQNGKSSSFQRVTTTLGCVRKSDRPSRAVHFGSAADPKRNGDSTTACLLSGDADDGALRCCHLHRRSRRRPSRRRRSASSWSRSRPARARPMSMTGISASPLARWIHGCACQRRARNRSGADDVECRLAALQAPHHMLGHSHETPATSITR